MSALALVVVISGLFPTYMSPLMKGTFIAKPFVHLHGFIFFTWILIGIVQHLLVQRGNINLHRKVGVLFALFDVAVIGVGLTMAIVSAKVDMANGEIDRPRAFLLPVFFCLKLPAGNQQLIGS